MQPLLTTEEAAQLLNVSPQFLERDRWAGAMIPFIRVGARAVRYDPATIQRYLEERTQRAAQAA